jgi:putative ABC transport system permease protein
VPRPLRRDVAVPVVTRLLAVTPVRSVAGAAGIGLALMLMLLLAGLWAGVQERVTAYDDNLGADLVVVQAGTQSLFADAGSLPATAIAQVAGVDGVLSAAPLRTTYQILEMSHGKTAVAAVGYEPATEMGGPWDLAAGRPPAADDEVVVDAHLARRNRLGIGDELPMAGHGMRVVGLSRGTDVFMTPLVFTTVTAMDRMLRTTGTTGAVLVGSDSPGRTAEALRAAGWTVRTPHQLREASLSQATQVYGVPVRLMVAVAFVAGTLVVALVSYARVAEQQRDLGVLRALGATAGRIRWVVAGQTLVLTCLGVGVAVVLLLVTRELLGWWRPSFPVLITWATLGRTAAAAAMMAVLGALAAAASTARLDPASAFRGAR